ncbi:P-loop NTPase fold protein [Roseofilum sp. Belize Diploria]|uniref:P-loop NTPase fold protein n=1 Tax=Roseofilum sp. Belize Diploria TaxID=2821501 RepID=UPI001B278382|nr:P-loop NTPase fold protein [Roseofilum sp. Belize Diploria]MBP0010817.1 AAA family ATPase [Roseofilum sp. Belize Diploria]
MTRPSVPFDFIRFLKASRPSDTIDVSKPEERKLYIDFTQVRGDTVITELFEHITEVYPDEPTCNLFTGHIGCGKSTELLKLRAELEEAGFYTIYFASSEDLELADVDIGDVLLAIARRISQGLEELQLPPAQGLRGLLTRTTDLLQTEFNLTEVEVGIPKSETLPQVGVKANSEGFSLGVGIGKITAKAKGDTQLRQKLNQFLGPQKNELIQAINKELIQPAIELLKQQNKQGLVIIVDNLDRIDATRKSWDRPQQEYLFIDQAEFLQKFQCHMVYTMPLALRFCDEYGRLMARYPDSPKLLPMVRLKDKNRQDCPQGMEKMRQMVLARAFPDLSEEERLNKVTEIFEDSSTLNYVCRTSGGHVRELLQLLTEWISKDRKKGKLTRESLEFVIRQRRSNMMLQIDDAEWELLRQVQQTQQVSGDENHDKLIHSRLVFEYQEDGVSWFDINPILQGAEQL